MTVAPARQFDQRRVRRWRREVWRIFAREGFTPGQISASTVLTAVASFGTDASVLVELTGLSDAYLRQVLQRLRKQGILRGQTLRLAGLHKDDATASIGAVLDAGVAAGLFVRARDPKRSAAQKRRRPETFACGPRRPGAKVLPGAVYTPRKASSNPLMGLPEWAR